MRKNKLISLVLSAALLISSVPLAVQPVLAAADLAVGDAVELENGEWSGAATRSYLPIFLRGQIYGIGPASHKKNSGIWLYDASSSIEGVNTLDETVSFEIRVKLRDTEQYLESLGGNNVIKHATGLQFSFGTDNCNSATVFSDVDINNDGVADRYNRYYVTDKATWDGTFKEIVRTVTYEELKNNVTTGSTYNPTNDTNLNLAAGMLRKGKALLSIGASGINYQYSGTNAAGESATLYDYAPIDLMGISVVKHYSVTDEETGDIINKSYTLYSWGSYSDGVWDTAEVGAYQPGELKSDNAVSVANGSTTYTLNKTLAPGKYVVKGNFSTDTGSITLQASSDGFASSNVTVTTSGASDEMIFSLDTETYVEDLTLSWEGDTANELYFSDVELEYASYAVVLNDMDKWTNAYEKSEQYVHVNLRGGGYGFAPIQIYDPAAESSPCELGVEYKYYIEVRRSAGCTDTYKLGVGISPNGYSTGRFHYLNHTVNDTWTTISSSFTIPTDVTTVEVIKIVQTGADSTFTDWDVRGIKVVEAANEDNVVVTLGCYDTALSPSEWYFPLTGSDSTQNFVSDEYVCADISEGTAEYDLGGMTLAPGIYRLSGNFAANAGQATIGASLDGINMTAEDDNATSVTVGTDITPVSFTLILEDEADASALVLDLGAASGNATALKLSDVELERIATIGEAVNVIRGSAIGENGNASNWVSADGDIEANIHKWYNFPSFGSGYYQASFDAKYDEELHSDTYATYITMKHNGEEGSTVKIQFRQGPSGFERYNDITTEWAEYKFNTGGFCNATTGYIYGNRDGLWFRPIADDKKTTIQADVDISGVKTVKNGKEIVYAWGVYADDYSAPPTTGNPTANFVDASSVKLTGADGGSEFTYDMSNGGILLPAGTYLIRADVKSESASQTVTFGATTASGDAASASVAVGVDTASVGVKLTVASATVLTGITLAVEGSEPIYVSNMSIAASADSLNIPNDSDEGWTGVEYVNEDYVTTTLRGGGYALSAIPLYDPANVEGSNCELGVEYKYYINMRYSAGNTDGYIINVGMSPNGYSTGRFHLATYTPKYEWTEFSNTFTIPTYVTTIEVMKIMSTNPSNTYTDWDFRGIKIVEAANEDNVVFALGCYDTTLDPSEWVFHVYGDGSSETYHHDEWLAADVSLGSAVYDVYDVADVPLARGVYALTGDFWTDAGTLMLDVAIGDNTAKEGAVEITTEKTAAAFNIAVAEGTPLSEIILSWNADTSDAAQLRLENLKLETVGTLAFGECGDDLEWAILGDGTLSVTGTGEMWDMTSDGAPWSDYIDDIVALDIAEGVTTIGAGAFAYCDGITGTVTLPSTLTAIGDEAFMGCTGITGIAGIPSGVTYIGASAFGGATALGGTLTIPEGVDEIGDYAFADTAFEGVYFEERNVSFGSGVFARTGEGLVIYGYANSTADTYASANGHTFSALREMLYSGFCGTDATWEAWSDGVLVISGTGAIENYSDGTDTPWYAHRDLITSIVVEEGITAIGTAAFRYLGNVKSATLPNTLTKIGAYAFDYCEDLESVNVPNGVTSIGDWAFGYCRSLKSIDLPNSVKSVGDYLFYKCASLVSAGLPADITAITDGMFENCYSLKAIDWQIGITEIGETAFAGCVSLNYIAIPDGVTTIGAGAFRECEWLYTLLIPDSVTSIGYGILDVCQYAVICGYEGSAAEEYADANGITFALIEVEAIASGELDGGLTWTVTDDGKLTVSGEGAMPDFDEANPAPWYEYRRHFDTVVISDGVTAIGDYAFFRCGYVSKAVIPSSVSAIGDRAFAYCTDLSAVSIPNGVASIGVGAFKGCVSLERVSIPNGVAAISDYTFEGCTALVSVTLPRTVKSIGECAFWGCESLTLLDLGGTETVGDYAFRYCTSLTQLTIPRSVTSIGDHSFADLHALAEVTVLTGSVAFNANAFKYSPTTATLYGFDGSTAQTFAKSISRTFVIIEDTVVDITDAINASLTVPTTATVSTADGKWYEGENTFSVSCDKPCRVFVSNDGGDSYDRLTATANSSGGYDFTATLTSESKIVVILVGDVDGDGTIELADYALAREIFLDSTYEADVLTKIMTDSNESGKITVSDITMIRRILLGYVPKW